MRIFRPSSQSLRTDRHDADLCGYAATGDAEAFRRLVERHLSTVREAAVRVLGPGSGWVDDVAQDVFLLLARKARQLPPDTVVCAWLHRQAVRRAIDVVRSESRRRKREAAVDLTTEPDEAAAGWNAIAPRLDQELLRLPRQDQEVLALRFMERCSSEEAGRRMGLSSVAVRKRVERALAKLRERLGGPVPGTLTVTALAAYLSVPTAKAASTGKAAAIATHCLAAPAAPALTFTTITLMTKSQIYTTGAILAIGAGAFLAGRSSIPGGASKDAEGMVSGTGDTKASADPRNARAGNSRRPGSADTFPATTEGRLAMLRQILSNPDALARNQALDRFIARLDPAEFKKIADYLGTQRQDTDLARQGVSSAMQMLISAWAKQDPVAALECLDAPQGWVFTSGFSLGSLRQTIASVWVARDPEAALAWAKARPGYQAGKDREDPFMFGLIGGLASQDIDKATALLAEMPFGFNRRMALNGVISHLVSQDEDTIVRWLDSLQDEKLKKGASNMVAREMAATNPQAAADWIIHRMGSDTEFTSIDSVFEQWMKLDPAGALASFENLPPGRVRSDAFNTIATRMCATKHTPENAEWIIARIGEGKLPDYSSGWIFGHWMMSDPESALARFEDLPAPQARSVSPDIAERISVDSPAIVGSFLETHFDRLHGTAVATLVKRMDSSQVASIMDSFAANPRNDQSYLAAMVSWISNDPQAARAYFDSHLDSMPDFAREFYSRRIPKRPIEAAGE